MPFPNGLPQIQIFLIYLVISKSSSPSSPLLEPVPKLGSDLTNTRDVQWKYRVLGEVNDSAPIARAVKTSFQS